MKAHCRQHRLQETCEQPCKKPPAPVQEAVKGLGKENSLQSEEQKRTFKCPLCSQTYSAPANLRAHMLVHEAEYETLDRLPRPPKEMNKQGEKGHTCPHCPYVCLDESSLNIHLSSVHKPVAQNLEKVAAPPIKQLIPLSSDNVQGKWRSDVISMKSYKCSECGKTFRHRSVLELHMRIHSKDKPYQCKVCSKGFRFSSYLQHQAEDAPEKLFKCTCGKAFAALYRLKAHQRFSHNSQCAPFNCSECKKSFNGHIALFNHQRWHANHSKDNAKRFPCEECGKEFMTLTFYYRHQRMVHSDETPAKSFLHQVCQLQKKAFECKDCGLKFSRASALHSHQLHHTDVFGETEKEAQMRSSLLPQQKNPESERKETVNWVVNVESERLLLTGVTDEDSQINETDEDMESYEPGDFNVQVINPNSDLELLCESDLEVR
uniref:Zgc:66448 n=1 Tax=Scophthalmus maximus TaxID=52904 RepID=A0A8D3CTL9_SCOMX